MAIEQGVSGQSATGLIGWQDRRHAFGVGFKLRKLLAR